MEPLYILTLEDALLDTSTTVVPAVQQTLQDYFSRYLGVRGPVMLASADDVAAFQRAGAFATPWALAAAMVRVALAQLPGSARSGRAPEDMRRAVAALQSRARTLPTTSLERLRERADFAGAAATIEGAGGGWPGVRKVVGKLAHPLFIADADAAGLNVPRRLFLEIFLGQAGFARVGGESASLAPQAGLLDAVTLRLPLDTLRALHERGGKLALLAPWPREIVRLVLASLGAAPLVDLLFTEEDITSEEARARRLGEPAALGFPHPWMIEEAARTLDPRRERQPILIAARPEAIRAARAAEPPAEAWALLPATGEAEPWRAALRDAGATRLFERPDELHAAVAGEG